MFRLELPEIFTGEDDKDFSQWVKRLEVAVSTDASAASKLSAILPSRLSGAAFTVWESLPPSDQQDFSLAKKKLTSVFGRKNFLTTFQSCINARPRGPSESIEVYAAVITSLVEAAFPAYGQTAQEGEKFRRFVAGLSSFLQIKIHELGGRTFDEAVDIALRVERAHVLSHSPLVPSK